MIHGRFHLPQPLIGGMGSFVLDDDVGSNAGNNANDTEADEENRHTEASA